MSPPRRPTDPILSSCTLATSFLILLALSSSLTFFLLFRPRSPTIHISAVQIPAFSSRNRTFTFTFAQFAVVRNPNRAAFSHYDSSLRLIHDGAQVGFIYIPAGEIGGGRAKNMVGRFEVESLPIGDAARMVEVESRMRVKGRVRVLRFLTHHVEVNVGCLVGVSVGDGSVIGFRC